MQPLRSKHVTRQTAGYLLFVLPVLFYLPSINSDFIWDDERYIVHNSLLSSYAGLREIWVNFKANDQYYPLTFSSFWLEFQFWGLWPGGYHLVNILLQGINTVLIWTLLSPLKIPGAWLTAAVFALHPVHVDSVAQISERKNVLSMLFYLLALLNYIRFSQLNNFIATPESRSWKNYIAAIVFLICALMSKTTACSFPAVILLLLWWKKEKLNWKLDLLPLIPFFVVSLVMSAVTVIVEREVTGATGSRWNYSLSERFLIAGRAFWVYIGKLLWPVDLRFMYPKWEVLPSAPWQYLFLIIGLLSLTSVFLLRRKIGKGPSVALFCFAGNLLPALGFINIYFMRYSFVADHFQYLASVSFLALVIGTLWYDLDELFEKVRLTELPPIVLLRTVACAAPYRLILSCIMLLILGILSWQHEYTYTNAEALWTEVLRKDSKSFVAHNNLGNVFLNRREDKQAITHFQAAIDLEPTDAEPHYNMAVTLLRIGRTEEAVSHGQRAVQFKPNSALFHCVLASALWAKGDTAQAIQHFRIATQLFPTIPQAHYNLGLLYLLEPSKLTTSTPQEAIAQFEKALALDPNLFQTQYALAWTLATFPDVTIRDGKRAVQVAELACQRTRYQNPQLLDALAAAYAENGQFSLAVQTAQMAVDLAHLRQQETFVNQINARLELYKTGKPYHDSREPLRTLKITS